MTPSDEVEQERARWREAIRKEGYDLEAIERRLNGEASANAILDEQIAIMEELIAGLKRLRRGDQALADLGLSTRTLSVFENENFKNLSEVAAMSAAELMRLPNFGAVCYREVWENCVAHGLWKRGDKRHHLGHFLWKRWAVEDGDG